MRDFKGKSTHSALFLKKCYFTLRILAVLGFLLSLLSCSTEKHSLALPDISNRPNVTQSYLKSLHASVKQSPDNSILWGDLGSALLVEEFTITASAAFLTASQLDNSNPKWLALRAVALSNTNLELALENIEKALFLAPNNYDIVYYFAYLNKLNGNFEKAAEFYKQYNDKFPQHVPVIVDLAKVYFEQQRYKESIIYFEKLYQVTNNKALIAPYVDRLERALERDLNHLRTTDVTNYEVSMLAYPFYNEVIFHSRSSDFLLLNASRLTHSGDFKLADDLYYIVETNMKDAFNPVDLQLWAYVKRQLKQNSFAKSLYRLSITRFPDFYPAMVNLADILLFESRKGEAEQLYTSALNSDDLVIKADTMRGLGRIQVLKGDLNAGLSSLLKSVDFNPNDPLSHEDLARIYGDLGTYKLAIQHLKKAQALGLDINLNMLRRLEQLSNKKIE